MSQDPSKTISPKVTAVGVAGAIMSILAWILMRFFGVELPADVTLAGAVVIMAAAGYFKRDPLRRGRHAA